MCGFIIKHFEVEGQSVAVLKESILQLNNTPAQTLCHFSLALKRLPYWIITCYQAAEREVGFSEKRSGGELPFIFSPKKTISEI